MCLKPFWAFMMTWTFYSCLICKLIWEQAWAANGCELCVCAFFSLLTRFFVFAHPFPLSHISLYTYIYTSKLAWIARLKSRSRLGRPKIFCWLESAEHEAVQVVTLQSVQFSCSISGPSQSPRNTKGNIWTHPCGQNPAQELSGCQNPPQEPPRVPRRPHEARI